MNDRSANAPVQLGLDMFADRDAHSEIPDPAEIREELVAILSIAKRAQDSCPWDERTFKYHKTVFPQMANWLPAEEGEQLRFEFAQEVERIEMLMAA